MQRFGYPFPVFLTAEVYLAAIELLVLARYAHNGLHGYGFSAAAFAYYSESLAFMQFEAYAANGVQFTARYKDQHVPVELAIPGLFSVYNALGVIAAGLRLGLTLDACAENEMHNISIFSM